MWGKNTLRSTLNKLQIYHTTLNHRHHAAHQIPEYTHNWKLVPFDSMELWSSAVTKAEMPSSRHCFSRSCFQTPQFSHSVQKNLLDDVLQYLFNVASKNVCHYAYPLFWTPPLSVPWLCHDLCGLTPMASPSSTVAGDKPKALECSGFLDLFLTSVRELSIPHSSRWLLRLWSVVSNLKALKKSLAAVGPLLGASN